MRKVRILVEGHGERDSVPNLATRLGKELDLRNLVWLSPARRIPGISRQQNLSRALRVQARQPETGAVLILQDSEDECPKQKAPSLTRKISGLDLPFPVASVLAYREYESLFLASAQSLAGQAIVGVGGSRKARPHTGNRVLWRSRSDTWHQGMVEQ